MKIDGTRAHDRATELVLAYYAACNRGDWAAMQALLSEDVVHDPPQGARETGKAAFGAFRERMGRSCREQLREVVVLASPDGTRAAAEYVVHGECLTAVDGVPPAHGERYVLPGGAFFDVADGLIARITSYRHPGR